MRSALRTGVPVAVAIFGAAGVAMGVGDIWLLQNAERGVVLTYFALFVLAVAWLIGDREVQLRRIKTPKADVTYDPNDRSVYVQIGDVIVDGKPHREHTYHLGIVNKCGVTLKRMRVVLDKCDPHLDHFIYLGKAIKIRGESDPDGYFDLPVSDNASPSRYAAFFHELIPKDGSRAGYVIPYVDRQKMALDDGPRCLTYRVEGGDMSRAIYFTVQVSYDDVTRRYVVKAMQ